MKKANELTWQDISNNFKPSTAKALENANVKPTEAMILDYFGNLSSINGIGAKKAEEIRAALAKIEFDKTDLMRSIGIHEIIYATLIGKKDATIPGGYLKEIYSWKKAQKFIHDVLEDVLNEQEAKVMISFFGLTENGIQLSLDECGKALNMSKDEVREMVVYAYSKLRTAYCRKNILDWCKNLSFKDYSGELKFDSVGRTLLNRMEIERTEIKERIAKQLTKTLEYIEEHDWKEIKAGVIKVKDWDNNLIFTYASLYMRNWFRTLCKTQAINRLIGALFGDRYGNMSYRTYPHAYSEEQTASFVDNVLTMLTKLETAVIACRFGFRDGRCYTLEECGKLFNTTRLRIEQIEAKALRKLRHPSRSKIIFEWITKNCERPEAKNCSSHISIDELIAEITKPDPDFLT